VTEIRNSSLQCNWRHSSTVSKRSIAVNIAFCHQDESEECSKPQPCVLWYSKPSWLQLSDAQIKRHCKPQDSAHHNSPSHSEGTGKAIGQTGSSGIPCAVRNHMQLHTFVLMAGRRRKCKNAALRRLKTKKEVGAVKNPSSLDQHLSASPRHYHDQLPETTIALLSHLWHIYRIAHRSYRLLVLPPRLLILPPRLLTSPTTASLHLAHNGFHKLLHLRHPCLPYPCSATACLRCPNHQVIQQRPLG